jgi:hypothetical protein
MKQLFFVFALAMLTGSAVAQKKFSQDYDGFLKRNPEAKSVHWKGDGHIVVIVLKSGKSETYNLADKAQKAAVESKYGNLPAAPPPPPDVVRIEKVEAKELVAPPPPPVPRNVNAEKLAPPPPPPARPRQVKQEKVDAPPPPPPPKKQRSRIAA